MSVAQFAQHVAQHLEQLRLGHVVRDLSAVASVHLVPVESVLLALVVEEAVVLVDGTPESLKVAARIVGILSLVDARRCEEQQRCKHYLYYSFHVSLFFKGVQLSQLHQPR